MTEIKECELYERVCIHCGECLRCDMDPDKICDNCMQCVNGSAQYRAILLDGITLSQDDEQGRE